MSERKLATREINLMLHLMMYGADGLMPVRALSTARQTATQLWRMGLVQVWTRQSLGQSRTEGPFYSLTSRGRELATSLYLSRRARRDSDPGATDFPWDGLLEGSAPASPDPQSQKED